MPTHARRVFACPRRTTLLLQLAALAAVTRVAPCALAQAPAAEEAVAVAGAYVDAMRAGDYDGMAALMHPDALTELRDMFRPVLAAPVGDAVTESLGLPPAAELAGTTDEAFFSAFMRSLVEQDPEMLAALKESTTELLGAVPEGEDRVHVVCRTRMTIDDVPLSEMGVISLARRGDGWRALVAGDVAGVAVALQSLVTP